MAYDTTTQRFTDVAAHQLSCWCGVLFAIPDTLYKHYRRENEAKPGSYALHCPLGHSMIPAGKSDADRLRDDLTRERARADQLAAEANYQRRRVALRDRQLAARKGQVTKLRKRIGAGVCPCCNRSFDNLRRHMVGQHPDWHPETDVPDAATLDGGAGAESPPPPPPLRFASTSLRAAWEAGYAADAAARNPYIRRGRGVRPHDAWADGHAVAAARRIVPTGGGGEVG